MSFKSARERRRHHTNRKTLARYKRQLNGADHKSWYASYHQHHDTYPLASYDDRTWYRTMRAEGTIGQFRGNHHPKYEDPWGERWLQTLCRARRDRIAMTNALAGYEDTGTEVREDARPGLRRDRKVNHTNATQRLRIIRERLTELRTYHDLTTDRHSLKLHMVIRELHTLERERERLTMALAA